MYFAPYVSVARRKAKAAKKIKQLRKKNPEIRPVIIEGKALAKTWWGQSWNRNLERYSDYSNRLGRGRSYARHGSVLDLQIDSGVISALVMGSSSSPYKVSVKIHKIAVPQWKKIREQCEGKLDSLQDLLIGKIPKSLKDIFMVKDRGLFPIPKEIHFTCSCPDGAYMCKHVAAVLYGVGARLDEDPMMFFKLRQANVKDLIVQAVKGKTKSLLAKSKEKSSRILKDTELSNVFGIDFDEKTDFFVDKKTTSSKKASTTKQNSKQSPIDIVEELILKSKKGIRTAEIKQKSGIPATEIYKIVAKLKRQKRIKPKTHGVYIGI